MNILILTGEFAPRHGGIGTYVREIALAAHNIGHNVTIVAPSYEGHDPKSDVDFPFSVRRFSGTPYGIGGIARLYQLLQATFAGKQQVDLVHVADWMFVIPLLLNFKARQKRIVFTVYGSETTILARRVQRTIISSLGFWGLLSRIVPISNFVQKALHATIPESAVAPATITPLAVNADWHVPSDAPNMRQQLGIDSESFLILTIARIVPRKGHVIVAEALALLPKDLQRRIYWGVIGNGEDSNYTKTLTALASQGTYAFKLLGERSRKEIVDALDVADLFCLAGVWPGSGPVEGFGLVFLEAGARGVPSVASAVGGVPDAIDDEVSGLLVPQADPKSLAAAIRRVMEDRELLLALGAGAKARSLRDNWAKIADQTYGGFSDNNGAL